jgi:hypothetical protein
MGLRSVAVSSGTPSAPTAWNVSVTENNEYATWYRARRKPARAGTRATTGAAEDDLLGRAVG